MDQVKFDFEGSPYSLKNIPIPNKQEYLLELVSSVGIFVANLRWRAFHFLNPTINSNSKETYGFKTSQPAPGVPELKEFENGIYDLVKNVKFKKYAPNNLQSKMKNDILDMNNNEKVYVAADETTNFYKLNPETHKELLENNITKDYKKANKDTITKVNKDDKKIAENLELEDRIYSFQKRNCFITMKDHKENFENNPKCRLLNPAKTELGKISKRILTRMIRSVREKMKFNHWQNTDSVIRWFQNLENKNSLTFIQFDIVEFYPSISEALLKNALNYAKNFEKVSVEDIKIILQTKKTLLFHNGNPWAKKGNKPFDVSMGSWDGAEVCELVGLYLLSQLTHLKISVCLYRDDGLAVSALKPRQAELEKKKICKIFKDNGLNITIEANVKSVNFLDVNFNLERNTFKPYMKPNDTPIYVHSQSNHPPGILKNIPQSVNRRLSTISSNQEMFEETKNPYQEALKKSGYEFELKFNPPTQNQKKSGRKRNITWFNPPFSKNVQTKIGEAFLKLVDSCFPPNHPLRKIVNRNTVKISYRCMPNMKKEISKHNSNIEKQQRPPLLLPGCNCEDGVDTCPLEGQCLVDKVVYQATVEEDNNVNTYTGLTVNTFKQRYYGHTSSFRHRPTDNKKSTTLSTHVWNLKDSDKQYNIKWNIIDRASEFNPVTRKCRLCLKEKYYIIFKPDGASLNERSELFSVCRHRLRELLQNT